MNADDVPMDIAMGRDLDPRASLSLHADAYTEQRWFEVDQRSVIGSTWQWVCHAEKLRRPGAFVTEDIAGMPIVAVHGTVEDVDTAESGPKTTGELSAERDELLAAILHATAGRRSS